MVHGIKIYFHEGYMMDSQQGNVLPEESRPPTKHARHQQTTLEQASSLTVASFSVTFRLSKVTEFYNYLQTTFFMVV